MERTGTVDATVEEAAVELVHRHSLDEIEALLVSRGVAPTTALKLVLLIPSAFAREHFEPEGIEFASHFFVGPKGHYIEKPYAAEPIYESARRLAKRWMSSKPSFVGRILDWSAEASSIKEAKEKGLTPSRMGIVHHGFDTNDA